MALVKIRLDKSGESIELDIPDETAEEKTDQIMAAIRKEREAAVEEALDARKRPVTTGEGPADEDGVFAGYDPDEAPPNGTPSNGTPPKNLDAEGDAGAGKDPSDGISSGSPSEAFAGFDPDGDDM